MITLLKYHCNYLMTDLFTKICIDNSKYYFKYKKYKMKYKMPLYNILFMHDTDIRTKYMNNIASLNMSAYTIYSRYIPKSYMYIDSENMSYITDHIKQIELINDSDEKIILDEYEKYICYEYVYDLKGNKKKYIKISSNYLKWCYHITINIYWNDISKDLYIHFLSSNNLIKIKN